MAVLGFFSFSLMLLEDEEVAARGFEVTSLEGLLEEGGRRGEMLEECAPGSKLGFAGALQDDVEIVVREVGEEVEDGGQEAHCHWWIVCWRGGEVVPVCGDGLVGVGASVSRSRGGGGGFLDFLVKDGVQEDFEGVGEVGEVTEGVAEAEGGGDVVVG